MSGPPQPKTFTEPKVRKRLKSKSTKTAARDRRYAAERLVFLAAHPTCEAELPHICTGRASEVHHQAGRLPSVFFDQTLWLAACHKCHGWITSHPFGAIDRGLSVRRNEIR